METAGKVFNIGDVAYVRGVVWTGHTIEDREEFFTPHKIISIRRKNIYGFRQNAYTLEGCRCEYAARDLLDDSEVIAERLKGLKVGKKILNCHLAL